MADEEARTVMNRTDDARVWMVTGALGSMAGADSIGSIARSTLVCDQVLVGIRLSSRRLSNPTR